jgi:hypothetical protein
LPFEFNLQRYNVESPEDWVVSSWQKPPANHHEMGQLQAATSAAAATRANGDAPAGGVNGGVQGGVIVEDGPAGPVSRRGSAS